MNILIKNKRMILIVVFMILVQCSFVLTGILNGDNKIYVNLTEIYCGAVAICLWILTIFRKNKSIYKYVGLGFIWIGILEYIKLIQCTLPRGLVDKTTLQCYIGNFEYLVVIFAFVFTMKKYSNSKTSLLFSLSFIFTVIYTNVIMLNDNYIIIFLIINIISVLVCYEKMKKYDVNNEYIKIYIIMIFINSLARIILVSNGNQNLVLVNLGKCIAYLVIYEGISTNIFKIEIENIKGKMDKNHKKKILVNKAIENKKYIIEGLERIRDAGERHYYNLIYSLNDGVVITDHRNFTYLNKKARRIFNNYDNTVVTEEDFKKVFNGLDTFSDNSLRSFEKGSLISNGREVEIHKVYLEEDSRIIYIKDLSELIKYENIRRDYKIYLNNEKIKNEFYANISHELRTPINVISAALDLNKMKIEVSDFKGIEENNKKIKKNCLRLIRTINNFIDANKIAEGYLSPRKGNYNIVEIIEDITDASCKYIAKKNIDLIFDSTDEEIYCCLDKDMIERVILNLLSNSIKHKKNTVDRGKIEVLVINEEETVKVVVGNNGQSITEREINYLFNEFSKINNGFTRESEGSGLGLFLAKSIIKAHSGELYFEENNDKNEFIIRIPKNYNLDKVEEERNFNMNSIDEKVKMELSDIEI